MYLLGGGVHLRLFLLAACVLFAIAIIVAAFNVAIVISAVAWIACGLFAWGLDQLLGGWVVPIAHTRSVAQPAAPAQPPAQV